MVIRNLKIIDVPSNVERAHNLSNGVTLGSGEAEELSQTWDTDWEQLRPKGW